LGRPRRRAAAKTSVIVQEEGCRKIEELPLAEKMKFPVGIGSGHFSADNVYCSLVGNNVLS